MSFYPWLVEKLSGGHSLFRVFLKKAFSVRCLSLLADASSPWMTDRKPSIIVCSLHCEWNLKAGKYFCFWEFGLYPWAKLCVLHTLWPHSMVWWSRVQMNLAHTRQIYFLHIPRGIQSVHCGPQAPICLHSSKQDLKVKWRKCSPNSSISVTVSSKLLWGDEHVTRSTESLFPFVKWGCPKVTFPPWELLQLEDLCISQIKKRLICLIPRNLSSSFRSFLSMFALFFSRKPTAWTFGHPIFTHDLLSVLGTLNGLWILFSPDSYSKSHPDPGLPMVEYWFIFPIFSFAWTASLVVGFACFLYSVSANLVSCSTDQAGFKHIMLLSQPPKCRDSR